MSETTPTYAEIVEMLREVPNPRLIIAAVNHHAELVEALREYLEWGAMTGSDREMFNQRFRDLLARIKEGASEVKR